MKRLFAYLLCVCLSVSCSDTDNPEITDRRPHAPQPSDTLYTALRAMDIYDYQPERALQIIDSAVIVGNISEVWADMYRARIYSYSCTDMDGHFDSARVIGERLLGHDSVKASIGLQQDVLEVLVYTARQQQDTARWLWRSQQLVDVCHRQGAEAEPEALRTEAEIGAALCRMGRRSEGMARIDSVLAVLDGEEHRQFNWLDATIIALKRKLGVLSEEGEIIKKEIVRVVTEKMLTCNVGKDTGKMPERGVLSGAMNVARVYSLTLNVKSMTLNVKSMTLNIKSMSMN